MLKGDKLTYIRHVEIGGQGRDYHFANMTVSDGLESVEIPIDMNLLNQCVHLTKGDKLNVDVEVTKQGNNNKLKIVKLSKAV